MSLLPGIFSYCKAIEVRDMFCYQILKLDFVGRYSGVATDIAGSVRVV